MATLHESDSADFIFIHGIKIIMRVLVDDDVGGFAKAPLQSLDDHRETVLALQMKQRAASLAAAYLNKARIRTDREMGFYGQRFALSVATYKKKGEKTPEYRYLFKGQTAATLLSSDELRRREEFDALLRRARHAEAAGPTALAALGALGDAIETEKNALLECQRADEALEDARCAEENARAAVVVRIRAMTKDVQSYYADDPGMARRVLGHGNAVATRRRNARLAALAEAEKAAAERTEVEAATEAPESKSADSKSVDSMKTVASDPDELVALAAAPPSARAVGSAGGH